MNGIQVTREAEAKDGLTLGDLIQLVQDAQTANVDPRATVYARVGFSAQVRKITAGGKIR